MIKAQFPTLLICTETLTWRQFYGFLEDFTLTIADPINEVNQQSGTVIKFDNRDQNKLLSNQTSS